MDRHHAFPTTQDGYIAYPPEKRTGLSFGDKLLLIIGTVVVLFAAIALGRVFAVSQPPDVEQQQAASSLLGAATKALKNRPNQIDAAVDAAVNGQQ
jgi:hypothetical protein